MVDTLLAMANYRLMPETSIIHFIAYPADTLYILTENQDTKVSELLDLGKKWRADSVEVSDGTNEDYGLRLKRRLRTRLEGALWVKMFTRIVMRSLFVIGGIEYLKYLNQRNRGLRYAVSSRS
ncbi:hypothetical protein [Nostoc sp. 'Peltigera membranacea cyanobiont' 210A]|uniref:hypothetical protein n=1 Tax=Nostoc sp. 'Peltigera membranacea cyanobiont' 210A TaxID=2014529 RepID=UPI001CB91EEF|nr:hypothetical protein [Nostoc sp. 'Peltigera membranacea cyanobiont' 210A]